MALHAVSDPIYLQEGVQVYMLAQQESTKRSNIAHVHSAESPEIQRRGKAPDWRGAARGGEKAGSMMEAWAAEGRVWPEGTGGRAN